MEFRIADEALGTCRAGYASTLDDCSLKPATKLDVAHYDFGHQWPSFLPDGKHFLYSGLTTDGQQDVLLGTLGSDVSEVLIHNASDAKYVAPEHLLFVFERNGYLFAQSFSLGKLRPSRKSDTTGAATSRVWSTGGSRQL